MIRDFIKKICYTPNSLRHDLEGELVFQHLSQYGPYNSLLDAGAGGGGYSVEILDRKIAERVVAVEAEPANYQVLFKRAKAYSDQIKTYECFLEDTPIEEESMDAVICNQVLEHIEDHDRAAQKLIDVLKPGGIAVVSVPRSPVARPQVGHVRDGSTEEEFAELFSSKGMEILGHDWFYTKETQKVRSLLRSLDKKKIYPPKFLFKIQELDLSAQARHSDEPMGLIMICRKKPFKS